MVSHGFGFYLDSKLLAESYFVSLRETMASGAKSRNRFDFLGFDLYSKFTTEIEGKHTMGDDCRAPSSTFIISLIINFTNVVFISLKHKTMNGSHL
jgi:hypothetical protein